MSLFSTATAETRPGYKLTKLGWIPQEWEVMKLKECCLMIKDGTHFSPVSKGGPRKYITSKNIRNGHLDLGDLNHISEEEHKGIYARCPVKQGDVLMTKDGAGTGNVCMNPLEEEFSLLSSVAVIRGDEKKVLNSYILQFLLSPIGAKAVEDEVGGQAITRITLEKIQSIRLPVPSIEEQESLTAILAKVDKSIRLTIDLIESKRRYQQGLMQQLLTGQRRFPEFAGQAWREVELGELFQDFSALNRSNEELPVLSCSKIYGIVRQETLFGRRIASADVRRYKVVDAGDLVYDPMLLWDASLAFVKERGVISPAYVTLHYTGDSETLELINHALFSEHLRHQYKLISRGTNVRRQKAPAGDFRKIRIKLPIQSAERGRIAAVLTALAEELRLLTAQRAQWQQQKQGLLQALLTGAVRVKTN